MVLLSILLVSCLLVEFYIFMHNIITDKMGFVCHFALFFMSFVFFVLLFASIAFFCVRYFVMCHFNSLFAYNFEEFFLCV